MVSAAGWRGVKQGLWVAMVSLCAIAAVQAEIYRWRDADGGTHFGDTPPHEVRAELLKVYPQASKLTPEQAKQEVQRLRDVEAGHREADQAKKAAAGAQAKKNLLESAARLERCEQAKWALSALESGRPVYRDERGMFRIKRPPGQGDAYSGLRDYLDDGARNVEISRQRTLMTKHCDGSPTASDMRDTEDAIRMAEQCEKAAADLKVMSQPESGAADEVLAARQAFINTHCVR